MKNTNFTNKPVKHLTGRELLLNPRYNKGTAFSESERKNYGLTGLLPVVVETLDQQMQRAYKQFSSKVSPIEKNLFLNELHAGNITLFYALVSAHLAEMMPIIYTPTIADAVTGFSNNYLRSQGLIIAWPDRDQIETILEQYSPEDVDVSVITDGEGVLGIGDQGVGGLNIAIGKLMVYTLCGGLNPYKTLAIQLDVGTNNEELLNNPLYLGWRHKRLSGTEYYDFIEKFVNAFHKRFPDALLHWEDFGRDNARTVLDKYRSFHQSFNDDIQGTGAVAVSALLTGIRKSGQPSENHKICIFGAGTAGTGIAEQICHALAVIEKTDSETIRRRMYLIDRNGLLLEGQSDLLSFQKPYARKLAEVTGWEKCDSGIIGLSEVIKNVHPTILIGCSTRAGAFSPDILREMYKYCPRPVIMPLSNPTAKAEATPETILQATEGNALIATGSPFGIVAFGKEEIEISQCNNALIFPGLGMGMLISKASMLTDAMLLAASMALTDFCMKDQRKNAILPDFSQVELISSRVALAVAQQAIKDGVAEAASESSLKSALQALTWRPEY